MTFPGQAADCGSGTVQLEFEDKSDGMLRTIDQGRNTLRVHVIGTFEELATIFTDEGEFHC